MEVVKIHAENAIHQKNQAVNFLRMSARIDAVAARVQTVLTMGKVTKSMARVVKSMDATLKTMNLDKTSALMANSSTNLRHWTSRHSKWKTQ